jgi:hypothetical protein
VLGKISALFSEPGRVNSQVALATGENCLDERALRASEDSDVFNGFGAGNQDEFLVVLFYVL